VSPLRNFYRVFYRAVNAFSMPFSSVTGVHLCIGGDNPGPERIDYDGDLRVDGERMRPFARLLYEMSGVARLDLAIPTISSTPSQRWVTYVPWLRKRNSMCCCCYREYARSGESSVSKLLGRGVVVCNIPCELSFDLAPD
jgi:hypothetical protein